MTRIQFIPMCWQMVQRIQINLTAPFTNPIWIISRKTVGSAAVDFRSPFNGSFCVLIQFEQFLYKTNGNAVSAVNGFIDEYERSARGLPNDPIKIIDK